MGIPHFYGWAYYNFKSHFQKELYRKILGLYIDGNAIVHDAVNYLAKQGEKATGKRLWKKIFKIITVFLVEALTIAKPRERFVLAIDGVVPAAKLNQQRIRRHAKNLENEEAPGETNTCNDESQSKSKSESNPSLPGFDRNIISPGTPFMDYIDKKLRKWFETEYEKPDTERILPKQVLYYSHRTPGEGEHKLFEAMEHGSGGKQMLYGTGGRVLGRREEREYNVVYGNDADLIVLGILRGINVIIMRLQPVRPNNPNGSRFGKSQAGDTSQYGKQRAGVTKHRHDDDDGDIDDEDGSSYDEEEIRKAKGKSIVPDKRAFDFVNCNGIKHDLAQYYRMTNYQDILLISLFVGNDFLPPLQACYDLRQAFRRLFDLYAKMVDALPSFKLINNGVLEWDYIWKFIKQMGEPIGNASFSREANLLIERSKWEGTQNYNETGYLQEAVTVTA